MIIATHTNNRFAPTGIWLEADTSAELNVEIDNLQINSGEELQDGDIQVFYPLGIRHMPPEEYALLATRWLQARDYGFPSEDASDLISQEIARRTWAA